MWQRKQTLYLLLAGLHMTLLLLFPILTLSATGAATGEYRVDATGIHSAQEYYQVGVVSFVLAAAVILLTLITVFLFKKRKVQVRLSILSILLIVAFMGVIAYEAFTAMAALHATMGIRIGVALPFVAILFLYLAIRGIIADEILVRSVNRLR